MSKVFSIHNDNSGDAYGWNKSEVEFMDFPSIDQKYLYLFMIGGSGASVLEPLLYYFEKLVCDAKYKIIPIFIDRLLNSEIVSRSINSVKHYQIYCAYSATTMVVVNPYLFIDDKLLFDGENGLQRIIDRITPNDTVALSFSLYNKNNIKVKNSLVELIRQHSSARIFNLVFLPYFNLDFGGEEFFISEDQVRPNLKMISSPTPNEHFFYIGLPTQSKYVKSNYQRNPFNVVSLIQSYAIASYLSKSIENNNSYYEFVIEPRPMYSLDDLFPGSILRQTVIHYDFKTLCWNLICENEMYNVSNIKFKLESDLLEYITCFYQESSCLIKQLGDKTVHQGFQIHFRKQNDINFDTIWRCFSKYDFGIVKWKYSKSTFIKELLSNVDVDVMTTSNMVIHELLKSIEIYTKAHWPEINLLYY